MEKNYRENYDAEFQELLGKTIDRIEGLKVGSEVVRFHCTDGSAFQLKYYQDCCASCEVEDVVGDV